MARASRFIFEFDEKDMQRGEEEGVVIPAYNKVHYWELYRREYFNLYQELMRKARANPALRLFPSAQISFIIQHQQKFRRLGELHRKLNRKKK